MCGGTALGTWINQHAKHTSLSSLSLYIRAGGRQAINHKHNKISKLDGNMEDKCYGEKIKSRAW